MIDSEDRNFFKANNDALEVYDKITDILDELPEKTYYFKSDKHQSYVKHHGKLIPIYGIRLNECHELEFCIDKEIPMWYFIDNYINLPIEIVPIYQNMILDMEEK